MSPLIRTWLPIVAIALSLHLGGYPLLDADEGRNAEVGREMAATNDYVMPRLNTLPYLDKPIVYFAAEAAVMEVLGPTETAARLPALLFTFATAALLFFFARKTWGEQEAWLGAIIFLSMPLTAAFARTVIFDSALTFFIVAAILAFHRAVESESPRKWATVGWAAIALGVLTKGPVAIALPLLVAIPYATWRKAFRRLWSIGGLIAFVAIIAPWVWAVSQVIPEFLRYVVVTETAARVATDELKRTGPPWYFLPYLIGGALPWSIVAIGGARELFDRKKERDWTLIYVLLWIAIPFVFFSISQSKRPQYILPVMPAVALLVARMWGSERRVTATRITAIALLLIGVILVVAPFVPQLTAKMKPVIVEPARLTAIGLGIAFVIGGALALAGARKRELALVALTLPVIAIPAASDHLMEALAQRRSAKAFVVQLEPHLTPQTEVIGVEAFTGSMAFYLRRTITVATPDATEFTSNYLMRRYDRFVDISSSPIRSPQWFRDDLERCCRPRVYVARIKDAHVRSVLEARGMPVIATGAHHLAYGPYTGR